ncbi:MAG: ATP-binding protein, partial [Deltaproteobacteria bacterium]
LRLDEYPVDGLREALVNAVAHRQYEDAGRKILLEVFADRVVLSSPGLPPKPITLASLRRGKYRPCSRNPVLAQCLSYFHRIEERGSGFRRMHDQMLDHGLDPPLIGSDMGYFQVTFVRCCAQDRFRTRDALRVQSNMTNHQLIINPLFVIINLTGFAFLSLELFFETLLSIWPTAESSNNRQRIPLNRQLGGRIYRQSIVKTQEIIEGEVTHAPQ